jgi:hypothetical protein
MELRVILKRRLDVLLDDILKNPFNSRKTALQDSGGAPAGPVKGNKE